MSLSACRKIPSWQSKAGFPIWKIKNSTKKNNRPKKSFSSPFRIGIPLFQLPSGHFFKFMATNLNFPQLVTWVKPLYCVYRSYLSWSTETPLRFWSSGIQQAHKPLSMGCFGVKLVQRLGFGFVQIGSWLIEPPRPAKALMYRRNPCFSRSREVCPAASAIGSMPDNPQLPFAGWRSATETTTQRTDWNRPSGSPL